MSHTVSGNCELDSHVDTCVAGAICVILEVTNQTVNVSVFSEKHEVLQNIPVVTTATAYDDPTLGIAYILVLGQAIYMENMANSLICPNQLRANGLVVEDCPRHLSPKDRPSSHSIYSANDDFNIPLSLAGVTSYFYTRTPTVHELESCQWITLSNENDWDPHLEHFMDQEENYQDLLQQGNIKERNIFRIGVKCNERLVYSTIYQEISQALDDCHIITTVTSTKDTHAELLALKWNIGLDAARKTLRCTTQKDVRNVVYPVERRFCTRQAQLRYKQLAGQHGKLYTDTFFSSAPTLNGSKMAQLYVNDLSFCKIYPMKQKSNTLDTLNRFIHEVGIPHALHSDDTPELMYGRDKQICKDYNIQSTYQEPYSPWQK